MVQPKWKYYHHSKLAWILFFLVFTILVHRVKFNGDKNNKTQLTLIVWTKLFNEGSFFSVCSTEESNSYKVGTSWGWANNNRIYIIRWAVLLIFARLAAISTFFLSYIYLRYCIKRINECDDITKWNSNICSFFENQGLCNESRVCHMNVLFIFFELEKRSLVYSWI